MRAIGKKRRDAFNKGVDEVLEPFHPVIDSLERTAYWCMTDCGRLIITPELLEAGDPVPSVFMKFQDTKDPRFVARVKELDANPYSGKWNIHSFDPEHALWLLHSNLKQVNARPLTLDEHVAWMEDDRIEGEKWAKYRQELNESNRLD